MGRVCPPSTDSSPTGPRPQRYREDLPSEHTSILILPTTWALRQGVQHCTEAHSSQGLGPCWSVELFAGVSWCEPTLGPSLLTFLQAWARWAWSCSLGKCPHSPVAGWLPGSAQVTPKKPMATYCPPDPRSIMGLCGMCRIPCAHKCPSQLSSPSVEGVHPSLMSLFVCLWTESSRGILSCPACTHTRH